MAQLILIAVMLIGLAATPTLGAGWLWDLGNGVGFVAFSGLIFLNIPGASSKNVQSHKLLGYAVLAMAALHAFWFLLIDSAVIETIKFSAPIYMWLGIAGFALLTVLVFIALPERRLRIHNRSSVFRSWHRGLAITCVCGIAFHIVLSGFYLHRPYQVVGIAVLLAVTILGGFRGLKITATTSWRNYCLQCLVCVGIFAGIRNLFG